MVLKLLPFLLAIGYALLMLRFSVWQTQRMLNSNSKPLLDAEITDLAARLAQALDVTAIRVHVFEVDAVNGLAAPDGRIFLTRGFLAARARGEVTDEDLASVIANGQIDGKPLGHLEAMSYYIIAATAGHAAAEGNTTSIRRASISVATW